MIDALDAGYVPDEVPRAETTVIHLTPSLFARPEYQARVEEAIAKAERVVLDLDDDWTRLLEIEGGWNG